MAKKKLAFKWTVPPALYAKAAEVKAQTALRVGARYLVSKIQRNINVSTRAQGPSKPGEFPHKDTGALQRSIFEADGAGSSVIVGTSLNYGRFLELGTDGLAARPFIRRTMSEEMNAMTAIIEKAMK